MIRMIPPIRAIPPGIDSGIARCRLILSLLATTALLLDPTRTQLPAWLGPRHAFLGIHTLTLAVFAAYFLYSGILYLLARQQIPRPRLVAASTWADVLFAMAIGFATEAVGSPFFVFFTFALVALGFRAGFRRVTTVAAISVALYLILIRVSYPEDLNFLLMRAVYLAIIGYLIGYLAQQRSNLEEELSEVAATEQCTRLARELHDGCVQTLGAVTLKLAACAELVRRGRTDDTLAELGGLQARINVEHDNLRTYMRSLTRLQDLRARRGDAVNETCDDTRFSVNFDFVASGMLADEVLQIVREGIRNVRRHAHAKSAAVTVTSDASQVLVKIDDDGIGFISQAGAEQPWTIASRVRELGGQLRIDKKASSGAHLEIHLASESIG